MNEKQKQKNMEQTILRLCRIKYFVQLQDISA